MSNELPRRCYIDKQTEGERVIREAIAVIETLGCHPHLTRAVILLGQAKDAVSDYVDGVPYGVKCDTPGAGLADRRKEGR